MKISLITGGTGGHVFPAIALGEYLQKRDEEVDIFIDKRANNYKLNNKLNINVVNVSSYSGSFFNKFKFLYTSLIAYIYYIFRFIFRRPEIVIGFGGYFSIPAIIAARTLCIPIMLHEQNYILGRVNKILSIFSKKIALSFHCEDTVKKNIKYVYTGNPMREDVINASNEREKLFARENNELGIHVTIVGGSQGANIFSKMIPEAIIDLPVNIKESLFVYHQVLPEYIDAVEALYANDNYLGFEIKSFFPDIYNKFARSDIIISRAGGTSVAEIATIGGVAIYIPMRNAINNHQFHNAYYIVEREGACLIKEEELTKELLSDTIKYLISSKNRCNKMALHAKVCGSSSACGNIYNLIKEYLNKKKGITALD